MICLSQEYLTRAAGAVSLLILVAVVGCAPEPDIRQYTIDTEPPAQLTTRQRMLGAIVPAGQEAFFFKVVGPTAEVDEAAEQVRDWIPTVALRQGDPQWNLPDGWKLHPGGSNSFDVATLELPVGEPPLELKVTKLGVTDSWDAYVSSNVNRWRRQMGLESSDAKLAGAELLDTKSDTETASASVPAAVWLDIEGDFGGGPAAMGPMEGHAGLAAGGPFSSGSVDPTEASNELPGAPFAGGGQPQSPLDSAPQQGSTDEASEPLSYETPAGWRPSGKTSMRWASFEVGPPDHTAELTVIPAGGGKRDNVRRWMGQIRPDGVDDEALEAVMKGATEVQVDGRASQRFTISGSGEPPQAIDATIIPLGDGFSLFVKMTGDAETVAAESERIGQFLDSMKLNL